MGSIIPLGLFLRFATVPRDIFYVRVIFYPIKKQQKFLKQPEIVNQQQKRGLFADQILLPIWL